MAVLTEYQKREIARRYWAIKDGGTVEGLAREAGISKPTLIKIASQYPELKGVAAPFDPTQPESEDISQRPDCSTGRVAS